METSTAGRQSQSVKTGEDIDPNIGAAERERNDLFDQAPSEDAPGTLLSRADAEAVFSACARMNRRPATFRGLRVGVLLSCTENSIQLSELIESLMIG
ncbi:MAG: hypothetical protein AB7O43_09440 [Hyphomicrobiaceae bacterium]